MGGATWHILSPSKKASEAIDSNDASLVTLFDLGDFALLGLGDLGEYGQQRLKSAQIAAIAQLSQRPLVLKVAHHGSKDQLDELARLLAPDIAIFSVGKNDYGHPTRSALDMMADAQAVILRTDRNGSIAIGFEESRLGFRLGGKLSA
jgi:competence protein ComEC